jgi:OOP family OmpA-OmpF porin
MNKHLRLNAILLSTPFLFTTVFANEQPLAEDLVGKFYGGAHLLYLNTDNDRMITPDPLKANDPFATADHGSGFGGELGYRFSESTEFRLSYSKINIDKKNSFFDKAYVAEIDALYFPTKQNFYVLGGYGYLDVGQSKPSLDLGAGYRHYLSDNSAVYLEGKGHYQFSGHYQETSAHLGFVFFFGDESKSTSSRKSRASADKNSLAATPIVASAVDSDKDGVIDKVDNCPSTPLTDKVDNNGCTIFNEENSTMNLLVNFDNDKVNVKAEYFPEIKKMANLLQVFPSVSLVIEGHTSKVGSEVYNQKISQQRSNAIVDVLVNEFSIDRNRLTAVGHGEERLIDLGDDAEAHAKNRRIEAKVVVTKKVAVSR